MKEGGKKMSDELRLPNSNDFTNIKSIKQWNKETGGKIFGKYLRSAWYFDKWYEKIILIGLGVLGIWKLWSLIF